MRPLVDFHFGDSGEAFVSFGDHRPIDDALQHSVLRFFADDAFQDLFFGQRQFFGD